MYDIFRNISDDDCYTLGFNPRFSRPENLIVTVGVLLWGCGLSGCARACAGYFCWLLGQWGSGCLRVSVRRSYLAAGRKAAPWLWQLVRVAG